MKNGITTDQLAIWNGKGSIRGGTNISHASYIPLNGQNVPRKWVPSLMELYFKFDDYPNPDVLNAQITPYNVVSNIVSYGEHVFWVEEISAGSYQFSRTKGNRWSSKKRSTVKLSGTYSNYAVLLVSKTNDFPYIILFNRSASARYYLFQCNLTTIDGGTVSYISQGTLSGFNTPSNSYDQWRNTTNRFIALNDDVYVGLDAYANMSASIKLLWLDTNSNTLSVSNTTLSSLNPGNISTQFWTNKLPVIQKLNSGLYFCIMDSNCYVHIYKINSDKTVIQYDNILFAGDYQSTFLSIAYRYNNVEYFAFVCTGSGKYNLMLYNMDSKTIVKNTTVPLYYVLTFHGVPVKDSQSTNLPGVYNSAAISTARHLAKNGEYVLFTNTLQTGVSDLNAFSNPDDWPVAHNIELDSSNAFIADLGNYLFFMTSSFKPIAKRYIGNNLLFEPYSLYVIYDKQKRYSVAIGDPLVFLCPGASFKISDKIGSDQIYDGYYSNSDYITLSGYNTNIYSNALVDFVYYTIIKASSGPTSWKCQIFLHYKDGVNLPWVPGIWFYG